MKASKSVIFLSGMVLALCVAASSEGSSSSTLSLHEPAPSPFVISQEDIAQQLGWVASGDHKNICQGYFEQPKALQQEVVLKPVKESQTHITASGATHYRNDGSVLIEDNVVITQPGRILQADKAYIYRNKTTGETEQIIMVGHVKIMKHNEVVTGTYAIVDYTTNTTKIEHSVFHQKQISPAGENTWGVAKSLIQKDDNTSTLYHATLSMCPPENPFWKITAQKVTLDKKKDEGVAHHAVLHIKDIPIFYTPFFAFTLSKERHSGFLAPSVGHSSNNGYQLSLPYYANLAPNYDDLFTTILMSESGVQLRNEFRYLTPRSSGSIYMSGLPYDDSFSQFKKDSASEYPTQTQYLDDMDSMSDSRGYISVDNTTQLNQRWSSDLTINYATDPYYFNDFETNDGTVWGRQLLNQWDVNYSAQNWSATALLQGYQTMHLINEDSGVVNQYQRLPEVDFSGFSSELLPGFDSSFNAQIVNFVYQSDYDPETYEEPVGLRMHLAPTVSYSIERAAGYVDPEVTIDSTAYSTNMAAEYDGGDRPYFSQSRTLPIFDVDTGLYFDRSLSWSDKTYTQTLEPRLFYLYVPYMDQDQYPVFDTTILPFSYEDLFSTNAYTGYDRLQNANQLSISLSSHVVDQATAAEKLKFNIGFINYFEQQKVCLGDSCSGLYDHVSPLVAQTTFYPLSHWSTTASGAWDFSDHFINNATVTARYNFDKKSVIDFGFDYIHANTATNSGDSDVSLVQLGSARPLNDRWSILGYWYYNVADDQLESYFAGLQYDSCCWASRVTANRYFDYSTNDYNTGYFFEFLFKGLGSAGTSASAMIASSIPGYNDIFNTA